MKALASTIALVLALSALPVFPVFADEPPLPGDPSEPTEAEINDVGDVPPTDVAAPPERDSNGIKYRTGGVGYDEREALTAATKDYSLKVIYGAKDPNDSSPAFRADVAVEISDEHGKKLFEAHDTGPWLLVKLPPGKYRVAASMGGGKQEQKVTIAKGRKQIGFYF